MTNLELAEALERVARVYREHPECPQPYEGSAFSTITIYCHSKADFAAACKAFGSGTKEDSGPEYREPAIVFTPELTHPLNFKIWGFKEKVGCKRVQVGTVVKPAMHLDAVDLPERVEPVWKWECGAILEGEGSDESYL